MIIVADSSPLIALGRIGRLDLLHSIFGKLLIPEAVWREVVEAGINRLGAAEVADSGWIERRAVQDTLMVALLRHDLGAGESEAIVLARETNADFILMDERLGRSAARSLGIKPVGIVGVLIEARERGLLSDAGLIVDQLHHEAGFWLSEDLKKLITG